MNGFYIGAITALVGGGWAGWQARSARHRLNQLLRTETMSTGMLRQLHEAATTAAGPGAYAEHVELEGEAQPGPGGPLTSEISDTPCVWYRQKVTHRFRERYTDSEGRRRTRTKEEVVADNTTEQPFLLRDADGDVLLVPTRAVQGARKVVSEFREGGERNDGPTLSFKGVSLNLGGGGDRTIGYEYEEWVLTAGTRIFVNGEATDRGGRLEVGEPAGKAKLVISTRSEQHLIDTERRHRLLYGALTAGLAILAVALLVVAVLR